MTGDPDEPELSRSDMRDLRGLLQRQDWGLPEAARRKILQRLVDYCDRDHEEGATARDRTVVAAARTIATFAGVSLRQRTLDLRREEMEARRPEIGTTVADAMHVVESIERALDAAGQDPPG